MGSTGQAPGDYVGQRRDDGCDSEARASGAATPKPTASLGDEPSAGVDSSYEDPAPGTGAID
jgi:hypothetical protein